MQVAVANRDEKTESPVGWQTDAAQLAASAETTRTTIELRKSPKNDKKLRVQLGGKPMLRN